MGDIAWPNSQHSSSRIRFLEEDSSSHHTTHLLPGNDRIMNKALAIVIQGRSAWASTQTAYLSHGKPQFL